MEAKFGPSEKRIKKKTDVNPAEIFQNSGVHSFWPKNWKKEVWKG
jgi:hypothetical protein